MTRPDNHDDDVIDIEPVEPDDVSESGDGEATAFAGLDGEDDGNPSDDSPPSKISEPMERGLVVLDPLQRYMADLRSFEPLSPDEEHELAVKHTEHGDVAAAYRLVTSHLRLVVKIAFEFKRTWRNLLDLIQEGNVGLLLAVRKFDPYRGIRLSTYATWWVRAYMIKFLLDNWRLVKVGTTNARRKLLFNLRKEKDALIAQGIKPVPKLLAERLNVSEQDVIEVDRSLGMPDVSIETPIAGDSSLMLGDTLPADSIPIDEMVADAQRHEILSDRFTRFATNLPDRERIVFEQRLIAEDPATLQELGDRFGLTREGLRQVEKRLLKKLKDYLVHELQGMKGLGVDIPVLPSSLTIRAALPPHNDDSGSPNAR